MKFSDTAFCAAKTDSRHPATTPRRQSVGPIVDSRYSCQDYKVLNDSARSRAHCEESIAAQQGFFRALAPFLTPVASALRTACQIRRCAPNSRRKNLFRPGSRISSHETRIRARFPLPEPIQRKKGHSRRASQRLRQGRQPDDKIASSVYPHPRLRPADINANVPPVADPPPQPPTESA